MVVRMMLRKRWHFQGLLLWLVQRPFLRRRTWPKLWLSRVQHLFTAVHLKDAVTLRSRMGLLDSFMEDEAVTFGLKAVRKRSRARQQAALVEETHRAVAALDGQREELARALIRPRGGLPQLQPLPDLPGLPVGFENVNNLENPDWDMLPKMDKMPQLYQLDQGDL